MAMEWHKIGDWAQDHPYATGGIVVALGLIILWYLGYFSSSAKPAADSGQSSLAGAYYAAEAQQAVVGGQIQSDTIKEAGATSRAGLAAQAAAAIAATYATRDVQLGQQHVGVSQIEATRDVALGEQGLLIARNNNDATNFQTVANNSYHLASDAQSYQAQESLAVLNTVIPQEIALTGGGGSYYGPGGQYLISPTFGGPTPKTLAEQGFSQNQSDFLLGVPARGNA